MHSVASAVRVDSNEVVRDDEDHGGDAEAVREVGEGSVRDHLRLANQYIFKRAARDASVRHATVGHTVAGALHCKCAEVTYLDVVVYVGGSDARDR